MKEKKELDPSWHMETPVARRSAAQPRGGPHMTPIYLESPPMHDLNYALRETNQ